MDDTNDLVKKLIAAVDDMNNVLAGAVDPAVVKEAKDAAEEILNNFQSELQRLDEANIVLRKENADFKSKANEAAVLKESVMHMEKQMEKMKLELQQALSERDTARAETSRIQALWNKVNR